MLLSKEKIIIAYYYIALIAFAVSACAVMFDQESSGGIAYTNFMPLWCGAFLYCVPLRKAIL